jgi:uncharacterized protein YutE (UPF0331/DUF86 family)
VTDRDLVSKKLAQIETCVQELRTLARPEEIENDIREERFVEHTAEPLQNMVGFRNILVHGYDAVDLGIVRDILANHLDDLLGFVKAVRAKL